MYICLYSGLLLQVRQGRLAWTILTILTKYLFGFLTEGILPFLYIVFLMIQMICLIFLVDIPAGAGLILLIIEDHKKCFNCNTLRSFCTVGLLLGSRTDDTNFFFYEKKKKSSQKLKWLKEYFYLNKGTDF